MRLNSCLKTFLYVAVVHFHYKLFILQINFFFHDHVSTAYEFWFFFLFRRCKIKKKKKEEETTVTLVYYKLIIAKIFEWRVGCICFCFYGNVKIINSIG